MVVSTHAHTARMLHNEIERRIHKAHTMASLRRATFSGFEEFKLTDVEVTDRELGHGSFATVIELNYLGLKCAGKKIHEILKKQGDASYSLMRFEDECHLLSQVRHPNIVQFLGVYFQRGVQTPFLVMEYLPTNATSCIQKHGIFPKEINYSILYDVALGLYYLHSQNPPIIHRDLSSNNVLLTPNMTAKISDLGVARILNLTPLQVSRMTQTPGTPAYMPPEVMVANPKYDTSVDEFSYGILMIHIFSGKWPEPQIGPNRTDPVSGELTPVTEAERRKKYLEYIGQDHSLMKLILKCIHNSPKHRAHSHEIVQILAEVVRKNPTPFDNKLEMMKHIQADEEERNSLTEEVRSKSEENHRLKQEAQAREEQTLQQVAKLRKDYNDKLIRIKGACLIKVKQLQLQVKELTDQIEAMLVERNAIKGKNEKLAVNIEISTEDTKEMSKDYQDIIVELLKKIEALDEGATPTTDTAIERNTLAFLEREIGRLQRTNMDCNVLISILRAEFMEVEAALKESNDKEEAFLLALDYRNKMISNMRWLLERASEILSTKQQSPQATISWKKCTDLPTTIISRGPAVARNGSVYYGTLNTIFSYNPQQDSWTELPEVPVTHFGLGHIQGKLAAIGGYHKDRIVSKVYTHDGLSKSKWKLSIPPMPTARASPGTLSLESALIVAAGYSGSDTTSLDCVEIFKSETSKWYTAAALPSPTRGYSMQLAHHQDNCYVIGGKNVFMGMNGTYCASIVDLMGNMIIPAGETTGNGDKNPQHTVWKTLAHTPTYSPGIATLAGYLISIGGDDGSAKGTPQSDIQIYSPSTNFWIKNFELPIALAELTAVTLSSTEILVMGGSNTVYTGTVTFDL